jgi:hypothetical protein
MSTTGSDWEGAEGVKWELGFAYFLLTGKMEFGLCIGLGMTDT